MIISLPVHTDGKLSRPAGALIVLVGAQLSVKGSYLPPLLKYWRVFVPLSKKDPPQMIISLPVQAAVWVPRPLGAFTLLVAIQVSVPGLYLAPLVSERLLIP